MPRPPLAPLSLTAILGLATALSACSEFVKPELPGETSYAVDHIEWKGVTLDHAVLDPLLSVRPNTLIIPGQPYNPYRIAEDRRRITAFWKNFGYFDVVVDKAEVSFDDKAKTVGVTWNVHEGPRYGIRSIDMKGAPDDLAPAMREAIGFTTETPIDMQGLRVRRHELADVMRDAGYLRSEVYSRTFVDRERKQVDWVFFADAGPKNVIGKLTVVGAKKVPGDLVLERIGLHPGDPIDLETLRERELDLADTSAYTVARIAAATGTEFETGAVPWETWIPPDTGGMIKADQVDGNGDLVPRAGLAKEVDLTVTLREAPSSQGELGLGVNVDLERVDPYVSGRVWLRNALGALNHLSFEAEAGYGLRYRGDVDEPLGVHGSARMVLTRPGLIGRLGDFRLVGAFEETLYPGYHVRTASGAIGFRTLFEKGLFLDIEPRFRWDDEVGVGTIDPAVRDALDLGPQGATKAGEARVSLVWDGREDGVEPLSGHLVALRADLAPVGDAAWLGGQLDLRYIIGLSIHTGLALKATGSWVTPLGDKGIPLGARLFGGGAWGMRGFGGKELSVYAPACGGAVNGGEDNATDCRSLAVGGESLFEGSVEFRWLPYRKQFGAVVFADFGAVGDKLNPFEDGVDFAAGLGLRVRTWHLPVGLDLAYRITDRAAWSGLDRFIAFLRVGEAF